MSLDHYPMKTENKEVPVMETKNHMIGKYTIFVITIKNIQAHTFLKFMKITVRIFSLQFIY